MKLSDVQGLEENVYSSKQEYADKVFNKLSETPDDALVASSGEVGGKFVIPVLIPEGIPSGDGRTFEKGAISVKDLPMPLLWQESTDKGHTGAVVVGRIDTVEPLEDGGWGNATGYFDSGKYGQEAERLVSNKFLQGISADMDNFEGAIEYEEEEELEEAETAVADGESLDEIKDKMKKTREVIKNDKIVVNKSRLIAATLVAKPAFSEAYITMADENEPEDVEEVPDGEYEESQEDEEGITAALVASAIPVVPPRDWFGNPELKEATPITVDDNGRVFGHVATWSTSHIGLPGRTKPPKSRSDYAYFRTGVVRTDDGTDVPVGQLTLAGGHAPLSASASDAVKHYDDTASAIADVTVGEDRHGIWVAGGLRPEARPEQVRALRASAPSGDWRPINGRLELVAVCQVNVPGFPVTRAMVAGGSVSALVAAGAKPLAEIRMAQELQVNELSTRLETVESRLNQEDAEKALSRLKNFASTVPGYKPLSERRTDAVARIQSFAQELSSNQLRKEKDDALVAAANKARKRIEHLRDK